MSEISYSNNNKFDIQLSQALIHERRLGEIFSTSKIEKIELKSETYQWEKTGNICIEYAQRGKPSGIAITEADFWVHELLREDKTLVYLMFPIDRLRNLAREAFKAGQYREGVGDRGEYDVVLLKLQDILSDVETSKNKFTAAVQTLWPGAEEVKT